VASSGKDEADPAHPGRESDQVKVLGGGVHRARHRPDGAVRRHVNPAAGAHEHLLQLGVVWLLCATCRAHGPGAGHHERHAHEALRPHLPTTSCSATPAPGTTGPWGTTLRVPSSSALCCALATAVKTTACRVPRSPNAAALAMVIQLR
jgi:hypothetical protein